jgi:hypothetical protein
MSPPSFGAQDLDHEAVLGASRGVGEQIMHLPNPRHGNAGRDSCRRRFPPADR